MSAASLRRRRHMRRFVRGGARVLRSLSCGCAQEAINDPSGNIYKEETPMILSNVVDVSPRSASPLTSPAPSSPPPSPSIPPPSSQLSSNLSTESNSNDAANEQEGQEQEASLLPPTPPAPEETEKGVEEKEDKSPSLPPTPSSPLRIGPDIEEEVSEVKRPEDTTLPTTPSLPNKLDSKETPSEVKEQEDEPSDSPIPLTVTSQLLCELAAATKPSDGEPSQWSTRKLPKGERVEHGAFRIDVMQRIFGLGLKVGTSDSGGIVVKALSSRSPLTKDGNIKVGDILLSVNGISLTKETTETAKAILTGLPSPGLVSLVVMAPPRDVTGEGLPASVVTTIGKSASNRELISLEKIVKAVVSCKEDCPIGFEIEGGLDSPLKYIYVKTLTPNSPAWSLGAFKEGDQLVMVGDECLIGLTVDEARRVLEQAAGDIEVVAQRKESPRQIPLQTASTTELDLPLRLQSSSSSSLSLGTPTKRSNSRSIGTSSSLGIPLNSSFSQERHPSGIDLRVLRQYLADQEEAAALVPQETHTIELKKNPKQKLGLVLVGGVDNPNLKEPHVQRVLEGGAAQKDGRLKLGDKIISVNGQSLSGMDSKKAVLVLREAGVGDSVTLVISRKIGRRTSVAAIPMPGSDRLSRKQSHTDEPPKPASTTASPAANRCFTPPRACAATDHIRRVSSMASSMGTVGLKVVELRKGPDGLGLKLMGGKDTPDPVMVKTTTWKSPAHRSTRIHRGDIIIEANGVSFEELTYEQAVKTMEGFPQGKVRMVMRDRAAMAVESHRLLSAASRISHRS